MALTAGYGFTGKTLRVDLSGPSVTVEDTIAKYGKYWGGVGMALKVLWDEVPQATMPFDPANRIIFGWGPLAGTGTPCSGRLCITSLCPGHGDENVPVIGAPASGHAGGHFTMEAKWAGWDGIIIQGKAKGPCYIAIRDDKVEVVDCPQLWGSGIYRITQEITTAMGPSCQVAAIGQAGQAMTAHGTVECNKSHSAGAGTGSVLGSKNCVGIGVIGTGSVKIAADKKVWKAIVENAMGLIGSCYDTVLPNSPQPWAEYTNTSMRWYAKKGQFWGAANPPVETGVCDPHDRQAVGYRCLKSDPGKLGENFTVRMNGCGACPIKCHQMLNIPTMAKWGIEDTFVQNTCSGWWARTIMDATKYDPKMATAGDVNMTTVEAYGVGAKMSDDIGLSNNYGPLPGIFTFIAESDETLLKPVVLGNTLSIYGKNVDEWNYLWMGNATKMDPTKPGYPAATTTETAAQVAAHSVNADSGLPGLLALREVGDLRALAEFGRIVTTLDSVGNRGIGKFANAIGAAHEWTLQNWKPGGVPIRAAYLASDESADYWGFGAAWHHGDAHTGMLGNIFNDNTHAQNHTWGPIVIGNVNGLPQALRGPIMEEQFIKGGYGAGMSGCWDYSTPMAVSKARAARFAGNRKFLHDSLGLCNWMYPWLMSPLKERGYRGDITLESQYWTAVTGDTKTCYELDQEAERFVNLQRCLTIKRWATVKSGNAAVNMRLYHDGPGQVGKVTGLATKSGDRLWYYQAQGTAPAWNAAGGTLEVFYNEMGWDRDTGAPTRAKLTALGMADVADGMKALFPGSIWG